MTTRLGQPRAQDRFPADQTATDQQLRVRTSKVDVDGEDDMAVGGRPNSRAALDKGVRSTRRGPWTSTAWTSTAILEARKDARKAASLATK